MEYIITVILIWWNLFVKFHYKSYHYISGWIMHLFCRYLFI